VKAAPRCSEKSPEEEKPERGSGAVVANRHAGRSGSPTRINALKARSSVLTSRGHPRQDPTGNDRRA
jgi:hypothetical protein